MDSHKYTPIDHRQLEIQLQKAIDDDAKYKREDAAKFRAAEQSKNYEEFRDIVKAAHLKPLEKRDSLQNSKISVASWNRTANRGNWKSNTDENLIASINHFESSAEDAVIEPLTNKRNFELTWLSLNDLKKQVTLLQQVIDIEKFFEGKDLSIDLIESLTKTLLDTLDPKSRVLPSNKKIYFVVKVMTSVSSSSRFSLNLQLLSDEGHENMRNLLNMIAELIEEKEDSVESSETVKHLANKYNCWEYNCQNKDV